MALWGELVAPRKQDASWGVRSGCPDVFLGPGGSDPALQLLGTPAGEEVVCRADGSAQISFTTTMILSTTELLIALSLNP